MVNLKPASWVWIGVIVCMAIKHEDSRQDSMLRITCVVHTAHLLEHPVIVDLGFINYCPLPQPIGIRLT